VSAPTIIGHERQRAKLKRLLFANKLPTAIMLAGVAGIGKSLVARELLRTLFCEEGPVRCARTEAAPDAPHYGGCSACHSCRLFDVGNLPDLHRVECLDKDTWNVERVRELLYSLNLKSFSGACRAVMINDAEQLSLPAANALLKALEEPRPGTYFCLVTSNPSRLPRTLLSRCQIWFFDALSSEQVENILKSRAAAEPESFKLHGSPQELAQLADGSLDNIHAISGDIEAWHQLESALEAIHKGDLKAAQDLAWQLSRDRESLRQKLKLMRIYARNRMRETQHPGRRAKWALCLANLIDAERYIFDRNINSQYVLSYVFLNLTAEERLKSFTTLTNSDTVLAKVIIN
jgi:DNA polymerase III gamma/tau subunit